MMIVGRTIPRGHSARLAGFWLTPVLAVALSIGAAAQQNTPAQSLPESPPQPQNLPQQPGSAGPQDVPGRLTLRRQGPGPGPVEAEQTLLGQASYWRTNQTSQAVNSLERLLQLDPGNADALAMLVQIDIDQDLPSQAAAALKRLQTAHPQDSRIPALQQSVKDGPPDPEAIGEARNLAQSGDKQGAIDAYRRAFKGNTPPADFAIEYYMTLEGLDGQFDAARAGLGKVVQNDPQNLRSQLAYAELLSYREGTRPEAVDRLQTLSQQPGIGPAAQRAWRQAILWQGADLRAQAQLEAYLKQRPADPEMLAKREEYKGSLPDEGTRMRLTGFDAMEAKQVPEADKDFTAALAFNPQDADSLIMLAVIRKFQGRLEEAKQFEARAMAAAPDRHDEFAAAYAGDGQAAPSQTQGAGSTGNARAGRAAAAAYARVTVLTGRGDYAAAESLLRRQMGGRPAPGNWVQLGYIQLGGGKLDEAEASFRRALAMAPRSTAGMSGLAAVLARRGDTLEAEALYARAGDRNALRGLGQLRAAELRQQGADAHDPAEKLRLLQAAVAADPASPWMRLDLARALRGQRQDAEATQVMAAVGAAGRPTAGDVQAIMVWAQESGDLRHAAQVIDNLPPRERTPPMLALLTRAQMDAELRQAQAGGGDAVARLLAMASHPDPTGQRGVAVAQALVRAGNRPAAQQALSLAFNATQPPTAAQRLAYAAALADAGFRDTASRLLQQVNPQQLAASDRAMLTGLQDGYAIQRADRLNQAGRRADARRVLTPRLQQEPENPGLNLALSRVYQGEQKPHEALALTESMMQLQPDDLDVRRAYVGAAVQARELDRAKQVAATTLDAAPGDPRAYLMAADVARADGNNGQALAALRKARELRLQQLKDAPGDGMAR